MVNVSIIIVNYNTYGLVKNCIESIKEKTIDLSYEVIVVDNDSPSREIDNIILDYPDIKYLKSNKNGGFGYANNRGFELAEGEYVFLLNSDTLLLNNAVKLLYEYYITGKNVGICGGNLFTPDLEPDFSFSQMFPSLRSEIYQFFMSFYYKFKDGKNLAFNFSNKPYSIDGFISGADVFMSAALYSEVNGFNENFFMYYEDTDLNWRVKKLGYEIHSVPTAKIIHINGGSQKGDVSDLQTKWMRDGLKLYYKSNQIPFYKLSIFIRFLSLLKSLLGNVVLLRFFMVKKSFKAMKRL